MVKRKKIEKRKRGRKEVQVNKHMAKRMSITPGNMRQRVIGPNDHQK